MGEVLKSPPSAAKPISQGAGFRIPGVFHLAIELLKLGSPTAKNPVGFGVGAPHSHWLKMWKRTVCNFRIRCISGAVQTEALVPSRGGAGCSET